MSSKNKLDRHYYLAFCINVVGTLLAITFALLIAHSNAYLYTWLASLWFIVLFSYELKTYHHYLVTQWQAFKQHWIANLSLAVLTTIIAMGLIYVSRQLFFNQFIPQPPLPELSPSVETIPGMLTALYAGVINLIVAIFEEIAYRHDLFYRYRSSKGLTIFLLIITNLGFGWSHYYNFGGSFLATTPYAFAGIIFSIVYLWRRNLWIPIIAHLIFNAQSFIGAVLLLIFHLIH